jgi:hypothetical protein
LETYKPKSPTGPPVQTFGVRVWHMMGRQIDWQALPVICDLLGVEDVEALVDDLLTVRDHVDRLMEAQRRG